MKNIFIIIYILSTLSIIISSCSDYKYINENNFIGEWELYGRDIYSGMRISITQENNVLIGRIVKKPDNNFGKLFLNNGDVWISHIKRSANHYFILTEFKIANKLFALYDLPTSTEYYATFSEDFNVIYLSKESPYKSSKTTSIFLRKLSNR